MSRRALVIAGLLALAVLVAAGLGLALATRGDDEPGLPGRVAVVTGCGLKHMWPDGTDRRDLCLTGIWQTASLSFNGEKLAWDTSAGSKTSIVLSNPDATEQVSLMAPDGANIAPSLSADGKHIAFLHSPRDDGRYDVWTTSTDAPADQSEQVTATRNVADVAWAPKGDHLAYVGDWSEETLEGEVFVARPDGDDRTSVGRGADPAWSPDGEQLAFTRGGDIWTVKLDGTGAKRVARNGRAPAWSRDGKQIAFRREVPCVRAPCPTRVVLVFANGDDERTIDATFPGEPRLLWLPDPKE